MRKNNFLLIFFVILAIPLVSASYTWIGNNVNYTAVEDTTYHHNLTNNVTGTGGSRLFLIDEAGTVIFWNDTIINYANISRWIYISNSTTGDLIINATRDNETGMFRLPFKVTWEGSGGTTDSFYFNVTPFNDAPVFSGLTNESFNASSLFERIIYVTDEENNIPFSMGINFQNCSTAEWSTRNNTNCTLFNSSQYSFSQTTGILNISFIPSRNDVGSYVINFTVNDSGNASMPYNASTSVIVNFSVLNVNSVPYFTYVCDNERNATEDAEFISRINVSDIDETHNLTLRANYSWFLFNGSSSNMSLAVNITTFYNASFIVNFTAGDLQVGNWSINISVYDSGSPQRINSSVFWFFINNTEDAVSLDVIDNRTIWGNTTFYVNATDNDLLVPDKRVKNESLSFASNNSAVNISSFSSSGNKTTAIITINFNALAVDTNYTIKVNVTDKAGNSAERNFTIEASSNNAPAWNQTIYTFTYYEGNTTDLNLSKYVNDSDAGDSLTFSYTNDTGFSSFNLDSKGIINFIPEDLDVGQHILNVNASDGKLNSSATFNFTIYNVNDIPFIKIPLDVIGATNDSNSNINATEGNITTIRLWIQDNDFKIPLNQKGFYNESLNLSLSIVGLNTSLFNFLKDNSVPTPTGTLATMSIFNTTFTPSKSDIGVYNITINVTDLNNASSLLSFNLTVLATNYAPVLMNLTNLTSKINSSFYLRINATDLEDGSSATLENNNFTFSYNFTYGSSFLNSSTFNSTTGTMNLTLNLSLGGKYRINITVRDSTGLNDSKDFWVSVYDIPNITSPTSTYEFNLAENTQSNLTFRANHSMQDNLTYTFYINNILRNSLNYSGNDTNLIWQFTPNYTDETFGKKNLTLLVKSNLYPELNYSADWNITINHTNSPVNFSKHIGDSQANYDQTIVLSLGDYFYDSDHSDAAYNQTINFSVTSNSTPSYITSSFSGFTLTLSSVIAVSELLTITASDLNDSNYTLSNASSNAFQITFNTPTAITTPQPSSGGGTTIRPVLLKIILTEPVSAYKKEKIILPIVLSNIGTLDLYGISLSGSVAKNNVLRKDISLSFDKQNISSLAMGKKQNVTLTIYTDTEETGLYEVTVTANVKSPSYSDWAKLYLTVKERNKTEVLEQIVFTEELIAENPQCLEIKEIIEEAKNYYDKGEYSLALEKSGEAVDACKKAIAQRALPQKIEKPRSNLLYYLVIFTILSLVIGVAYYSYKRIKLRRALAGFG